jgi:hypothetical protein
MSEALPPDVRQRLFVLRDLTARPPARSNWFEYCALPPKADAR